MDWEALQGRSKGSRKFLAAYDGECDRCMSAIDQGDSAGYVDGDFCCEDCYDKAMRDL